jgi:hypothetical protein
MSEKKISYTNRTFDEYRNSLIAFAKQYYPDIANDFNDASVGSWLIDMVAAVSDNLGYHIDRVYNETNIDSAQQKSSIFALAKSNGFKVPGPKGSIVELKFTCYLPLISNQRNSSSTINTPNEAYAPTIKAGTMVESGGQYFEVINDVNFREQYNEDGVSDRIIEEVKSNGSVTGYRISKTVVAIAGESRVYKQVINSDTVKPFMEIIIPDVNVMNVESIIFKRGSFRDAPKNSEFYMNKEFSPATENSANVDIYRFFEVESLLEQYRWGDAVEDNITYKYKVKDGDNYYDTASITKGQWMPLTQKFITEFTDKGYLKVIFGGGISAGTTVSNDNTNLASSPMYRMIHNDCMGKLPPIDDGSGKWTMYIKYRVGGGSASNIAADSIKNISYLNVDIAQDICDVDINLYNKVKNSITVTNTVPSVSGKDAPSVDEIRNMIKYHKASQERCVTLKDYEDRIAKMPPRYGSPFRISAMEENNKVMIYTIGIDNKGHLSTLLPEQLKKNMINYLSMYRSINDFVEIKSGRIINISFDIDLFIEKEYNTGEVLKRVKDCILEYMDINKRHIGEEIFVGDIQKEIAKIDGVLNVIDIRIFNETGEGYSNVKTSQETTLYTNTYNGEMQLSDESTTRQQIDLSASDYLLKSDGDCIFELKYPANDINFRVKTR